MNIRHTAVFDDRTVGRRARHGYRVLGITGLQMVSFRTTAARSCARSHAARLRHDRPDAHEPTVNYGGLAMGAAPPVATNCFTNTAPGADGNVRQGGLKCSLGDFNTNAVCAGLRDGIALPSALDQLGRRRTVIVNPGGHLSRQDRDDHGQLAGTEPAGSDLYIHRESGLNDT